MSRQYKQNAAKKRLKFKRRLALNLSSFCLSSMPRAQYSINLNPSRERRIAQARIKIARVNLNIVAQNPACILNLASFKF